MASRGNRPAGAGRAKLYIRKRTYQGRRPWAVGGARTVRGLERGSHLHGGPGRRVLGCPLQGAHSFGGRKYYSEGRPDTAILFF